MPSAYRSRGSVSDLPPKLRGFLDTLALFDDRADRIQLLIDVADRFQEVPTEVATRPFDPSHEVQHCESGAFVWVESGDDGLHYHFAVENPQGISAKAMAVILKESLDGQPLEAALTVPQDLPYEIFGKELSMGKSMGLTSLVALTQKHARLASGSA